MTGGENSDERRKRSLASLQGARAQPKAEPQGPQFASHDRVTGLPGAAFFADRVDLALLHAEARGHTLAVAWLDLDGVAPVRELYGVAAEEACIAEIGRRLRVRMGAGDFVARVEPRFGLLFEDLEKPGSVRGIAEALLKAVRTPFDLRPAPERAPVRVVMNARMGIALYPQHGRTRTLLLDLADEALEEARGSGSGVRVHD